MAADVRKDETDSELESCSIVSDSITTHLTTQFSDLTVETEYETQKLPSHTIVYQQMRDVLLFQRAAAEHQVLQSNESLNATKQSLNNSLEDKEKAIKQLELSIQNDYVPKEAFLQVQENLMAERAKHKETLAHLAKTLDKLESSQKELAELSSQAEKERTTFEKCCNSLRDDVHELKSNNRDLKLIIEEKTQLCEEFKSQISTQKHENNQLKNKHEKQKVKFKQKVTETEVEKQQEAYLRKMETEQEKKTNKMK